MILKKFYADNVKKAREKAFNRLGEDCIVLESREANENREASVTVMLDNKKEEILKNRSRKGQKGKTGTYDRKDLIPDSLNKIKETVSDGFEQFTSDGGSNRSGRRSGKSAAGNKERDTLTLSRRSTPVYNRQRGKDKQTPDFQQRLSDRLKEKPISKEVKALHKRFDRMEKRMSEALITANIRYVSHPAFQQLLNTGMEPTTVTAWFEQVLNKGIDPYEQSRSFMFELADIVRSALSVALPEPTGKNLLFVGPSGSGKTSLIMKLASHPDFMLDKSVALVSIEPRNNFKQYSSLQLFANDIELPFYKVRDGVEMTGLLTDLQDFDHVLFDSPSISLHQQAAFRDFWKIRQILSSANPLEIHYTINATLERYYFRESYAANHPLQPDYIAITHLDETNKWGRLIPFINAMGANVRYVSQGADVPDNIHAFKPEWFAEKILSES